MRGIDNSRKESGEAAWLDDRETGLKFLPRNLYRTQDPGNYSRRWDTL